jgi:hypothetical protein
VWERVFACHRSALPAVNQVEMPPYFPQHRFGTRVGRDPGAVFHAALDGRFDIVTSTALLDEPRRVLAYPKLEAVIDPPANTAPTTPASAGATSESQATR